MICEKCMDDANGDGPVYKALHRHRHPEEYPPGAGRVYSEPVACEWCGRAIDCDEQGRWYAVKGKERGYDPLVCDAVADRNDTDHSPAPGRTPSRSSTPEEGSMNEQVLMSGTSPNDDPEFWHGLTMWEEGVSAQVRDGALVLHFVNSDDGSVQGEFELDEPAVLRLRDLLNVATARGHLGGKP